MTNDTLLLSLRAESLEANLTRLSKHLAATPERLTDLDDLAKAVANAQNFVKSLRHAKIDLGGLDADETLDGMEKDLTGMEKNLTSMLTLIKRMKTKCFQVAQTQVGKDIVSKLATSTSPVIATLKIIQNPNFPDPAKGWVDLRVAANSESEPIFTDYMELLGGAALRDTGFDEKISLFADQLLRAASGDLLALPTRRLALVKTFERIVRVTFPDWTVWALPSAALEFWNVMGYEKTRKTLEVNESSLSSAEKISIQKDDWQSLGDAYATYTMGPAYAYYAVGLMLAPDTALHQDRVRAILAMLEEMEKTESKLDPPYVNVRRQLLEAWNGACIQLAQPKLNLDVDRPQDADQMDPAGAGVRILTRILRTTLDNTTSAKFGVAIWNEVHTWVDRLLADEVDKISIPAGVELRHLLNAAWQARVSPARNPGLDLNTAVKKLQAKIQESQEGKGK